MNTSLIPPTKRKIEKMSTIPDFVKLAHVSVKEMHEIAEKRRQDLVERMFCKMATKVKAAYVCIGQKITVSIVFANNQFNFHNTLNAFDEAKKWMEILGWNVTLTNYPTHENGYLGEVCIQEKSVK